MNNNQNTHSNGNNWSEIGRQSIAVQFSGLFILNCTCTLLTLSHTRALNMQSTRFSLVKTLTTQSSKWQIISRCVCLPLTQFTFENMQILDKMSPSECTFVVVVVRMSIESNRTRAEWIELPMQIPPIFITFCRWKHQPTTILFWESKKSKIASVSHSHCRSVLKIATAHKF